MCNRYHRVGLVIGWLACTAHGCHRHAPDRSPESGPVSSASSPDTAANTPGRVAASPTRPSPRKARADDGRSLWESPTQGTPVNTQYLPDGTPFLVILRPNRWLQDPAHALSWQALGPAIARQTQSWEDQSKIRMAELLRLTIAWSPAATAASASPWVLIGQLPADTDLAARWSGTEAVTDAHYTLFRAEAGTLALPTRSPQTFLWGAHESLQAIFDQENAIPRLRREMQMVLEQTDNDHMFTILFSPSFFYGEAEPLLHGNWRALRDGFGWLIGDHIQAGLVSIHMEPNTYLEFMLCPSRNERPLELHERLSARWSEVPARLEAFLKTVEVTPHWQPLAARYGKMIDRLVQSIRMEVRPTGVIGNAVLPPQGAHNLLLATELALASPRRTNREAASPESVGNPRAADRGRLLEQPITFAFDQQSLEGALRNLAEVIAESYPPEGFDPIQIVIRGADLQRAGITQNQQIVRFQAEQQSIANVLTQLVVRANPSPDTSGPADPRQQLVWRIDESEPQGRGLVIAITTRSAAEERRETLPAVFQKTN